MTNDEMHDVDLNEVAKLRIGFWVLGIPVALCFAFLLNLIEAPWWVPSVFVVWAIICGIFAIRWWRLRNSWRS